VATWLLLTARNDLAPATAASLRSRPASATAATCWMPADWNFCFMYWPWFWNT